jgi:Putative Ig domain
VATSFPFVQKVTGIGPYGGAPSVSLPGHVAFGNVIVAVFGAYRNGSAFTAPTGVTDSLGNYYVLKSTSNGFAANETQMVFMWVAQGNSTTKYGGIAGGACTVTFNGFMPGGGSGVGSGPSLIVTEYETPDTYECFSAGTSETAHDSYASQDQGGTSSAADATVQFRACANNGSLGGGNCSDTGLLAVEMLAQGVVQPNVQANLAAVAFVNQFFDVLLVIANYNAFGPTSPYFAISAGGTIRATTYEPTGGASSAPGCSLGLADFSAPYLHGPLTGECDKPPNGTVGTPYGPGGLGHSLVATGGTPPYTWALIGGMLPPGLTLSSAGLISGTPTAAGLFYFTAQVTDAVSDVAPPITCSIAICPAAGGGQSPYGWTG